MDTTSLSQPQPAGTGTSTSTSTITNSSNGKRASANGQQPAASRYLPREVPPRFRQQEQKQLLKRGQPLPTGTLTGASPPQGTGQAGASPPPQPGAGGQHHPSKTQTQTGKTFTSNGDTGRYWGLLGALLVVTPRQPYQAPPQAECPSWDGCGPLAVSRLSRVGPQETGMELGALLRWRGVEGCRIGAGFQSRKQHGEVPPAQCGSACQKMVLIKGIAVGGWGTPGRAGQAPDPTPRQSSRQPVGHAYHEVQLRKRNLRVSQIDFYMLNSSHCVYPLLYALNDRCSWKFIQKGSLLFSIFFPFGLTVYFIFLVSAGWGEMPTVHAKTESSWGEPSSPSAAVDNGTSAWGKPPSSGTGWGDNSAESAGTYGRANAPAAAPALCKPASKSMQEGWGSGGDEVNLSTSQWEDEEGDMWNNTASQESNSSCNSWGNAPKKGLQKGMKTSSKQDEAWIMNRLIKQLTDMGFPREPAEEALKSNNMNLDQAMSALLEKKVEMDKRGMGVTDYNGMVTKPLGCRPPSISKESSMDRPTFLDKDGGLVEEPTTSPFLPSPSLKLPLSNSALPNQTLGGIASGLGMQNLNSSRQIPSGNLGMFGNSGAAQARTMQQPQQPPVQPLNSSQPSLRAQVPQFLSPQVQAQLLQFAAKNIGLNPALLTSPINPQHMTMLNQLYQLQLAYQRLQIQQQMLQAQRNVSGPMRQQEQQVARTINNMQQQIQQHQRQLAQALLMKQQPPPPHLSLHPSAGKSAMDSFSPHPQAPGLPDLQTKEQQSSPNTFAPYPLAGLNPNMNVNSMDITGGLSVKDTSQSQSRLPQWTHPNSMDNLSSAASSLDQNSSKHGAIPGGLSIGPPGKSSIDDSYGRYDLIQNSDSPASPPVAVPHSWSRAKTDSDKISNGSSINWPPEFHPGVPWKGLQNIDPENDPDVTPGSVPTGPTINTTIQDVNRYLLKSGGKLSDIKSTWSSGPISHTQASLSHELWKVPRNTTAPTRPPPGLTNTKPSSTWGASPLGWTSSYSSGSAWSTDSSGRTSSWLVLRNLTPQIDGSTLRTLCLQHGPLITFHLNLTQGNAVVRYSSKEEAAKAQKSLHMCVLGNTTILAEFAGEEEVNRFLAQGQPLPPTSSWQSNTGTNQTRMGSTSSSHGLVRNDAGHWNTPCLAGKGSSDLLWGGVPQYSSSLWGPPSTDDGRVIGSPTPLNTLLPGDLLSGESI
uniref:Trinucleotide repeat-containing gene 6C protein n=1 Tax=Terrapene triunguis TaxID=2587831 RepID=A0A674K2A0_9SAUR